MLSIKKGMSFEDVWVEILKLFLVPNIEKVIRDKCKSFNPFNGIEEIEKEFNKFVVSANRLIHIANCKVMNRNQLEVEWFLEENKSEFNGKTEFNYTVAQLSKGLTFFINKRNKAEKFSLRCGYIEYDYIFNLLQYAFYAIVVLESKAKRRFYTAFTLDQRMYNLGENNKLTYFGTNSVFYINPTEGKCYRLPLNKFKGLKKRTVRGFEEIFVIEKKSLYVCAVLEEGGYIPLYNPITKEFCGEIQEVGTYRKKSEGGMPWLSFYLGKDSDLTTDTEKSYYIQNHTAICLAVYGLDIMKYGILDYLSLMSVDHISKKHDQNEIGNLRMVSTYANELLKTKPNLKAFDFFEYWTTVIKAGYRIQENYNFRVNN